MAFLADGKELAARRQGKSSDALTSFNSRDKPLHLFGHVVDDYIVTAGVADDIVVKVNDIVADIAFETKEEPWLHVHAAVVNLLGGGELVSRHSIDLL